MTPEEARAEIEQIETERAQRIVITRNAKNAAIDAVTAEYAPRLRKLWRISRGEPESAGNT